MAETKKQTNQGPSDDTLLWVIGGGIILLGGYYVIKTFFGPGEGTNTIKTAIIAKVKNYKAYFDSLELPMTEEEFDRLSQMEQSISLEERELAEVAKSQAERVIHELGDTASTILIGTSILIGSIVGGYVVLRIVNKFKDKGRGGGDFGGSGTYKNYKTGNQFSTSEDLKHDIATYSIAAENVAAAQTAFKQLPNSLQIAVASEAGIYSRAWTDWVSLSETDLKNISWAAAYLASIGVAAIVTLTILESIPIYLLVL